MSATLPDDELAWARDCYLAGDTLQELAAELGCSVAALTVALNRPPALNDNQRQILSLYAAGLSFEEIDQARGFTGRTPGKAAAACVTALRRRGLAVPHRLPRKVRDG